MPKFFRPTSAGRLSAVGFRPLSLRPIRLLDPPADCRGLDDAPWYRRRRAPRYQHGSDPQGGCREVEVRTGSPLGTGHLKTAELRLEGRDVAEHERELRMRARGGWAEWEGRGRRRRLRAASAVLAATRIPKAEMEEATGGTLATERLAERGARDGTRPAGRQLRQRDWRRANWGPRAIRSAP